MLRFYAMNSQSRSLCPSGFAITKKPKLYALYQVSRVGTYTCCPHGQRSGLVVEAPISCARLPVSELSLLGGWKSHHNICGGKLAKDMAKLPEERRYLVCELWKTTALGAAKLGSMPSKEVLQHLVESWALQACTDSFPNARKFCNDRLHMPLNDDATLVGNQEVTVSNHIHRQSHCEPQALCSLTWCRPLW